VRIMTSSPLDETRSNASWLGTRTVQYAFLGVLAGVLFPIIGIALELARRNFPVSFSNVLMVQRTEPSIWIIETAPLFLGIIAALAGRRQDLVLQANKALTLREAELSSIRENLEQIVTQRTQELDQRNAQMRAVVQFARQIAEFQDLPALLNTAVRTLSERFNWQDADLYLLDDGGQSAVLRASASPRKSSLKEGQRVAIGDQHAIGRVVRRGRPYISAPQPGKQEASLRAAPGIEIAIPLITRGKVIGALDAHLPDSQPVGQNDMELFQLVADQLAAAIENVRLVSDARTTAEQLKALTLRDTRVAWQTYLKNKEYAYRFTPAGMSPTSPASFPDQATALDIPLTLRGQRIGSIALHRRAGASWTQADQDLLDKVSAQVVLALENARLLDETRQRAVQQQVVSEISARLNRSLEVDAVLESAVREFAALPDVAEAEIVLVSTDNAGPQPHNRADGQQDP
jgi:GAF domain-containing protein